MNLKLNQAVLYKSGLTHPWTHGTVREISPRAGGFTGYYIGGWHFSTEAPPDEIANDDYSSYPMNWVRLPILKQSLVKE